MRNRNVWRKRIGFVVLLSLLGSAACAKHAGDGPQGGSVLGQSQPGAGAQGSLTGGQAQNGTVSGSAGGGQSGNGTQTSSAGGESSGNGTQDSSSSVEPGNGTASDSTEISVELKGQQFILPEGNTLSARIAVPEGYARTSAEAGSLTQFLRDYPMKEDGAPVLLYDGTPKGNQRDHAAVFKLPIEAENLQQCADSVMRVYAEYYWTTGQYDKICFHFSDGFAAKYAKWREGYRIRVNGDDASWTKSKSYDDSYEAFQKYMRIVFAYAGTASMESEAKKIALSDLRAGDVFLKGGSPGHVVMVVDLCENAAGQKAFLLAQGYMPAQEFHVLKNPLHEDEENPWYYEDEVSYPFVTPEYVFPEGSLKRLDY